MEVKSVTHKGMPLGVKDLNNGYSEIIDPISELTTTMMTSYNDEIDKYIFSQLNTDNNFVHIEKPKMPQVNVKNFSSVSMNYRMLATKTKDRVFESEKEVVDLQALRTFLHEYNIDFKNMCLEEVKRAISR